MESFGGGALCGFPQILHQVVAGRAAALDFSFACSRSATMEATVSVSVPVLGAALMRGC